MNFKELALTRNSVRDYLTKDIEEEILEVVLNTARMAPSAVNFQPFKLYVLKKGEVRDAVNASYHREWMKKAPVLVVVVGSHDMAWKRAQDHKDYTDIDAALFIDHLQLQATDLGLGSCWVCNFDVIACREALSLKPLEEPIAIVPVGYPAKSEIPVKKRKGLDELVVYL